FPSQNLKILDNTMHLTDPFGSVGIDISIGGSGIISNNVLDVGVGQNSIGLWMHFGNGAANFSIQGNDFQGDKIGVKISGNSIAGIDLGGGSQGSLGGNNFRSFTSAATATSGAIVTDATT